MIEDIVCLDAGCLNVVKRDELLGARVVRPGADRVPVHLDLRAASSSGQVAVQPDAGVCSRVAGDTIEWETELTFRGHE